jgi:hypothetical protein
MINFLIHMHSVLRALSRWQLPYLGGKLFRFIAGVLVGAAGLALTAFVADELSQEIKVGDLIQWTINGSDQFPKPKKVKKIERTDDGTAYLFVKGVNTGIPAAQASKV